MKTSCFIIAGALALGATLNLNNLNQSPEPEPLNQSP
jgi:hypothetical protein